MKHGSLFSGIGGFDLAAEWAGWENVFHCEIDPFCRKVLHHYWPDAATYEDVTTTDFTIWRGRIDILTGGFPCQPYSMAGKRLGKEDSRHLWPHMCRAIREIQPTWVVGENVFGLVNWNGGMVFEEVQADLEAEGYEVQPYVLPAASVNAPHKRDRVWFVAYANHYGYSAIRRKDAKEDRIQGLCGKKMDTWKFDRTSISRDAADTCRSRWKDRIYGNEQEWPSGKLGDCGSEQHTRWESFPTEPPVCIGNDVIPDRLDGITFPKLRKESIKAAGNAVVPHLVYQIFRTINEYENLNEQTNG